MQAKASGLFLPVLAIVSLAAYYFISYLVPRPSFFPFILLIGCAFLCYGVMAAKDFAAKHFTTLLWCCLLFRLVFLFAIPELSDDYARFIWDGMLNAQGVNVYAYTPAEISSFPNQALPPLMENMKAAMNSSNYYSVYPPFLQLFFYLSVKLGGANLVADLAWLRGFALLAEAGTIFLALKLLKHFNLPRSRVFLYALNPLVIVEFSGNLHGEVFMLLCLAATLWFLVQEKLLWSAACFGLAVSTKLMPLILLPAVFAYLGFRKGAVYGLVLFITLSASFLPFIDSSTFQHISSSVGLYYDRFEFNASIYYLLLWIGYDVTGVNIIFVLGKIMSVCSFLAICWFGLKKINIHQQALVPRLLFTVVIYYFLSLVVHPWYITVLLFPALFTSYRFAYAWSALVFLTYSAYMQLPYQEILWVTALEYLIVTGVILVEYKKFGLR
ncbi:MAG: hypothetical protein V4725_04230 [Bacteroidota bacterium]